MAAKSEEFIEQGKKFTFKLLTCKVYKTCRFLSITKLILPQAQKDLAGNSEL
jgi:hypothetical protein